MISSNVQKFLSFEMWQFYNSKTKGIMLLLPQYIFPQGAESHFNQKRKRFDSKNSHQAKLFGEGSTICFCSHLQQLLKYKYKYMLLVMMLLTYKNSNPTNRVLSALIIVLTPKKSSVQMEHTFSFCLYMTSIFFM